MPSGYISRPIADSILSSHYKVLIIEGARAVGKTMLAKEQLEPRGFTYVTLAKSSTYQRAKSDPESWFHSLPKHVIIDEAQRLDELPLLVKEATDYSTASGPQYILTGSASIGRSSLDGQDPLVRRAARFTVSPLTQREIDGTRTSIIDDLWQGELNPKFKGSVNRTELMNKMSVGGFPHYVTNARIMSNSERSLAIRSDITSILGNSILPGEKLDSSIANAILQELLALPGNILNVSRIAKAIERDKRTVTDYLNVLMNRFLISPLPNQKLAAAKQLFTRAKIHPVDSSFSVETFRRAGKDLLDPVLFGSLFESFIANQIIPAIEWSDTHPEAFYWRDSSNKPKEIDLLLAKNDSFVGIEAKSSESVDERDFRHLQAFAQNHKLTRGYVVYTGTDVIQMADRMWAIPIDALWHRNAFTTDSKSTFKQESPLPDLVRVASETPSKRDASMPSAANIFLSYNHKDNEHLGNAIIQFVEQVIEEYEYQYADTLSLFVDSQSISWGQDWQKALDRGIQATNFLMPAITPRYMRSASCIDELMKFYARVIEAPNSHILSMIWQPIDAIKLDLREDKARSIIQQHQYIALNSLRNLPTSSPEYKTMIQQAAEMLHEAIELSESSTDSPDIADGTHDDQEELGLLERLDQANAAIETLQGSVTQSLADVDVVVSALNSHPAPSSTKAGVFSAWSNEVARASQEGVDSLNDDLDSMEAAWGEVREFISSYIAVASRLDKNGNDEVLSTLYQLKRRLELPSDIDALSEQIGTLQSLSPRLKPMSKALRRFVDIAAVIAGSIDELIEEANNA